MLNTLIRLRFRARARFDRPATVTGRGAGAAGPGDTFQALKRHRKVEADDGGWLLKFVSPATPGVPDNIKLRPIPEAARELVARYFRFVEFKAPGKKPNRHQPRVFARLRELGFTVDVIDQLPTKED